MSRYSSRASSGSTARARTSPSPGAVATLRSAYGSGAVPRSWAMPWRPSTSASRVRRPSAARARARAAATVVLPTPPLPVTRCSRPGQRSLARTLNQGSGLLLDVADEPAAAAVGRDELQLLGGGLLVGGGEGHGRGQHRAVFARLLGLRAGPRVRGALVLLVLLLDLLNLGLQLLAVPGRRAHQRGHLGRVLGLVDRRQEALRRRGRGGLADAIGVAGHHVEDGQPAPAEDHEHDERDHRDQQAAPLPRLRGTVVRRGGARAGGGPGSGRGARRAGPP